MQVSGQRYGQDGMRLTLKSTHHRTSFSFLALASVHQDVDNPGRFTYKNRRFYSDVWTHCRYVFDGDLFPAVGPTGTERFFLISFLKEHFIEIKEQVLEVQQFQFGQTRPREEIREERRNHGIAS